MVHHLRTVFDDSGARTRVEFSSHETDMSPYLFTQHNLSVAVSGSADASYNRDEHCAVVKKLRDRGAMQQAVSSILSSLSLSFYCDECR